MLDYMPPFYIDLNEEPLESNDLYPIDWDDIVEYDGSAHLLDYDMVWDDGTQGANLPRSFWIGFFLAVSSSQQLGMKQMIIKQKLKLQTALPSCQILTVVCTSKPQRPSFRNTGVCQASAGAYCFSWRTPASSTPAPSLAVAISSNDNTKFSLQD